MTTHTDDRASAPALPSVEGLVAEWEKAAEGVTPGPWHAGHLADDAHPCNCRSIVDEGHAGGIASIHVNNGLSVSEGGNDAPSLAEAKRNLAWLARCSPDNVLSALRSLSARRAEAQMATETQAKLYRQALRRAEAAEARASSLAAELAARKETPND